MATNSNYEGGCLCGAVRYRSEKAPFRVAHCHCTMCRKAGGGPFLTFVVFPVETFTWIGQSPARYRSSPKAERAFCSQCGSTLAMFEDALPDWMQVAAGSLDRPELLEPQEHIWTDSQLYWAKLDDGLPRYPRFSPQGGSTE